MALIACVNVFPKRRDSQEFPSVPTRDWPNEAFDDLAVKHEIIMNDAFDKRRFRLEVKWSGGNGSAVHAYINLNGIEHEMVRSGSYLWTFDDNPTQCISEYRYWYRATHGSEQRTIGSASQPLTIPVSNWNNVSWYEHAGPTRTSNGDVFIYDQTPREARLTIQNLTPNYVTLVRLAPRNDPDCPKFQLLDVPPTPHTIQGCAALSFRVKWNPQGNDLTDICQFDIDVAGVPSGGVAPSMLDVVVKVVGTPAQ
jgi:hypothetical protein